MTTTTTRIRSQPWAALTTMLLFASACTPQQGGATDPIRSDPDKHESLLARPAATQLSGNVSPEFQAELDRLAAPYDMNSLPVIRDENGNPPVAKAMATARDGAEPNLNPSNRLSFTLGDVDLNIYWFIELPLPSFVTDADGGTIRLIMQHEIDGFDQVRVIDEHIGTEFDNDAFGRRGRFGGRYGWTRQSGGGEWSWILGDGTPHNLATPWDWAFITDYRWLQDNSVLGGDFIRVYSHPHVTTRVIFMD